MRRSSPPEGLTFSFFSSRRLCPDLRPALQCLASSLPRPAPLDLESITGEISKVRQWQNVCSKAELDSADVESFGNSGQAALLELGRRMRGQRDI